MKTLIIFLITSLSFSVNAQNDKIDFIEFEYSCPHIVFSGVEISIYQTLNIDEYEIKAKYYNRTKQVEKQLYIKSAEFNKLIKQFRKIKNVDIINSYESGLDGATTSVKVSSSFNNSIEYSIWGLHKSQTKSKSKELLKMIQLILNISNVKIDDFN